MSSTPVANRRGRRTNANNHPAEALKEYTQKRRTPAQIAADKAEADAVAAKAAEQLAAKEAAVRQRVAELTNSQAKKDAQARKDALRIDLATSSASKGANARNILRNLATPSRFEPETISLLTSDVDAEPSNPFTGKKGANRSSPLRRYRNFGHGQDETTSQFGPVNPGHSGDGDQRAPAGIDSPTLSESDLRVIDEDQGEDQDESEFIQEQVDATDCEFIEDLDESEDIDDTDEESAGACPRPPPKGRNAIIRRAQNLTKEAQKGKRKKNPPGLPDTGVSIPPITSGASTKKRGRMHSEHPEPPTKRAKPVSLGGLLHGFPFSGQTSKKPAKKRAGRAAPDNADDDTNPCDGGSLKNDEPEDVTDAIAAQRSKSKVIIQVGGGHPTAVRPNNKIELQVEEMTSSVFKHASKLGLNDLPFCLDYRNSDFRRRWTNVVQPSLRQWAGALSDPFGTSFAATPDGTSLPEALDRIFSRVYPELRFSATQVMDPAQAPAYRAVALNSLVNWRSSIGKVAITVVNRWVKEEGLKVKMPETKVGRMAIVNHLTSGCRLIFLNPDGNEGERGPFQSPLVSKVFRAHLTMTEKATTHSWGHQVGGLALATSAIIYALDAWANQANTDCTTGSFKAHPYGEYARQISEDIVEKIDSDDSWDEIIASALDVAPEYPSNPILGADHLKFTL